MLELVRKLLSLVFAVLTALGSSFIKIDTGIPTGNPEKRNHVQYGSIFSQCYDYYLPKNLSGKKDIIFIVHGGSWTTGTDLQFKDEAIEAAKLGYIAVSMDYRKLQEGATAFDMVDDMGAAVASLKSELTSLGIKIDKMAVAGWSSGAHLALLYSYEYYLKKSPIPVAFVCVCAPPTDFISAARFPITLMGAAAFPLMSGLCGEIIIPGTENLYMDKINAISPVSLVKKGVPPTIIVYGSDDDVVPTQNGERLYELLKEKKVDCAKVVYKGAGHFLGERYPENTERARVFFEFADKYL